MPHRPSKKANPDKATQAMQEHPRAGKGFVYQSCRIVTLPDGQQALDCNHLATYYESGSEQNKLIISMEIDPEISTLLNQRIDLIEDPSNPDSVFDYVKEVASVGWQPEITKESISWEIIQQPD